jgi:hypothetical protein
VSAALGATRAKSVCRCGWFEQRQVQTLQVTLVTFATGVRERFEVRLGAYDATSIVIVVLFFAEGRWLRRRGGGGARVQIVAPGPTHSTGIALRGTRNSQNLPFFWK